LPLSVDTYQVPDGSEAEWDIFGVAATVAVLALTSELEVVLARQFRPGPGLVLDVMPGGMVEEGEEVAAAATRELLEETGFVSDLELAGSTWLAAASRTRRWVAVGRGARRVADPSPAEGEFCEPVIVSLDRFRQQLSTEDLTDTDLGYMALDYLGLLGRR
jgi:ADP-ribose diphosphatase